MEDLIIREQEFYLHGFKGQTFGVRSFLPDRKSLKGIIQLIPGMAEHAGRYREFASIMARNGYGVFAGDHPGSGITAGSIEKLGILPANLGWEIMLENIRSLYTYIRKDFSEIPVFVLGHSMGSILARHFTAIYPVYIQGLILSGTFETPKFLVKASNAIVSVMMLLQGPQAKSRWFNKFFFGNLNRHFKKDGPTPYEWISSVREEVDAYNEDVYCGFDCSWGFFNTLFKGVLATKKAQINLKYRKTLPLLSISGDKDPVGNFGKDVIKIHRHFYRQRFQNITMKVFKGRHELFHDETRDKVFFYLLNWLDENLKTR
jgi:alpha-beta hydrolase superfamily lysophospholipase